MKKKRIVLLVSAAVLIPIFIFLFTFYHADQAAIDALVSDAEVQISQTDYGWYFDGPSDDTALIFYPGAKVEETAYAPLLHRLAAEGVDVCLVKMPLKIALLGINKAEAIQARYSYKNWYIGGHSLGGTSAAYYAKNHADELTGMVFCAAYSLCDLDDGLKVLTMYGSEDHVLSISRYQRNERYLPSNTTEIVIEGGNHAQFGNYGWQQGDGTAEISVEEQQEEAAEAIALTVLAQ